MKSSTYVQHIIRILPVTRLGDVVSEENSSERRSSSKVNTGSDSAEKASEVAHGDSAEIDDPTDGREGHHHLNKTTCENNISGSNQRKANQGGTEAIVEVAGPGIEASPEYSRHNYCNEIIIMSGGGQGAMVPRPNMCMDDATLGRTSLCSRM